MIGREPMKFSPLLSMVLILTSLPAAAVTIWPVGDSLTSGFNVAGGYRTQLYNDLTAAGQAVNFVGSSTADAAPLLSSVGETNHDGHSGWFIADASSSTVDNGKGILENVATWYAGIAERPDIILLMIGTNDINRGNFVSTAPGRLNTLVTRLAVLAPDARIIVGSIPTAKEDNAYKGSTVTHLDAAIRDFNAGVVTTVGYQASLGRRVEFLDVYGAMDLADLSGDGLHFTKAGYNKLGSVWAGAILVPEPGSCLTGLFGIGLLLTRRRRDTALL